MILKALNKKSLLFFFLFSTFLGKYSVEASDLTTDKVEKAVTISSKNAVFDQKSGLIILQDNVHLIFSDFIFSSDQMTVIFEKIGSDPPCELSQIKKISAKGNVLIQREEQTITSNLANFFPKENKINMIGNVKIVTGDRAGITSEELEIDLNSGTSNFTGNVSSKILMGIEN